MADDARNSADLDAFLATPKRGFLARHARRIAIGVGLVLALLALAQCLRGPPPPEFVVETVRRGDISRVVEATGNLAPTNQIDIGSEISGIVESVNVDVNARVEKGAVLAVIDTSRLRDVATRSRAALEANVAAVGQAEATLREASAQLSRFREVSALSNGRVPSRAEMATQEAATARARAALRSAKANVDAARAQLSSDEVQLGKAVIRSPVSGVILKRSIDPGQTVQASFNTPSLFIVAEDLSKMKLDVAVDEADVGDVREGLSASFSVDAYPGRSFPARILRVNLGPKNLGENAAASSVVSYVATLGLDNADGSLRPGMTATAAIAVDGVKNALVVPNAALRFSPPAGGPKQRQGFSIGPPDARQTRVNQERGIGAGSRQTIYVLEGKRLLRPLTVVTGKSDGRLTAVTGESLAEGMRVVTGLKSR